MKSLVEVSGNEMVKHTFLVTMTWPTLATAVDEILYTRVPFHCHRTVVAFELAGMFIQ